MNAPSRLKLMEPADTARWDAFVERCDEATFFHRAGWRRVIEEAFGHRTWFFYVEEGDEITGVLPLGEIKSRLFGHALVALPFCVYGGIAATSQAARTWLAMAANDLARTLQVGHLEYRSIVRTHIDDPSFTSKDLYYTFRRPIEPQAEANMAAIPRKQRAVLRKAMAAGLSAHIDDRVERTYDLYARSVHRLGTPVFRRRYFELLKEVFGEACELRIVSHQGQALAGAMSFYFRDTVLPYYAGSAPLARSLGANDFMYWSLMRDAARRDFRIFDFGRSKAGTGAFEFKRNWGFEPQPLPYEYKLFAARRLPDNQPLNPKFRAAAGVWKLLPLPLANRVGPLVARNLG